MVVYINFGLISSFFTFSLHRQDFFHHSRFYLKISFH